MKIKHLKFGQIDYNRWDEAIALSTNALPYAYSWFLAAVSPHWEALVTDDYSYVMPLPVKKKFGIKYLIQPRWVQQLGVFSAQPITEAIVRQFLAKIPYLSYDFNTNFANGVGAELPNSIIPLNRSFDEISAHFSQNTQRNIAKAKKANLAIQNIELEQFLEFWDDQNADKPNDLYKKLVLLCYESKISDFVQFWGVFSPEDQLIAALLTVETNGRIVYLAPASNAEGKAKSAMFLLVEHLLKTNAETDKIFDCEGSQIPGVARFYRGFGAISQPYFHVKRCRPMWLVNLLHR